MRDLFGNPPDGSFMAWVADHGLYAALAVVAGILTWWLLHRITHGWIERFIVRQRNNWLYGDLIKNDAVMKWADEAVIAVLIGVPTVVGTLDILGFDISPALGAVRSAWDIAEPWLATHGVKIAVIIIVGWVAMQVLGKTLPRLLTRVILKASGEEEAPEEAKRRADTLSSVFTTVVSMVIAIVVLLTILQEMTVPIGPVLGSLGLVGVAVGFGSQWLVRDVVAGAFIIGENQYRQGDVVSVAGVSGLVESINLRRTLLRDIDGKLHSVPNGEIKVASNLSRKWARMNVDIGVAYKHDTDHVLNVLTEIGAQMAREPYWGEVIIDPPKPLGIDAFADSSVNIKVLGTTKPLKNWEVRREFMYRVKKRFDQENIEIPFPHRTLYWGDGSHPQKGEVGSASAAEVVRETLKENARSAALRRAAALDTRRTEAVARAEDALSRAFERLETLRQAQREAIEEQRQEAENGLKGKVRGAVADVKSRVEETAGGVSRQVEKTVKVSRLSDIVGRNGSPAARTQDKKSRQEADKLKNMDG